MYAIHRSFAAICLAFALVGCGGAREEEKESMPVEDTVFGDTVGTMDKARAVEETTLQHKEELDRAMQDAEEGR